MPARGARRAIWGSVMQKLWFLEDSLRGSMNRRAERAVKWIPGNENDGSVKSFRGPQEWFIGDGGGWGDGLPGLSKKSENAGGWGMGGWALMGSGGPERRIHPPTSKSLVFPANAKNVRSEVMEAKLLTLSVSSHRGRFSFPWISLNSHAD